MCARDEKLRGRGGAEAGGQGDVTAVSEAKIHSKRDFAWVQRGRVPVQTTHWQIRKAQKPNRFLGGRVWYGFLGGDGPRVSQAKTEWGVDFAWVPAEG